MASITRASVMLDLVTEVRDDLRQGRDGWATRIAEVVREELRAQVVMVAQFDGWGRQHPPTMSLLAESGYEDADSREGFVTHLEEAPREPDPMLRAFCGQRGDVLSRRRRDLVSDRRWYRCATVMDLRRGDGLDDALYSGTRHAGGQFVGIALHRSWGDRAFDDDDRDTMRAVNAALREPLGRLQPGSPSLQLLPPSLRRVAELLTTSKTERDIADAVGLTYQTVHTYCRRIYQHVGVGGRVEFFAWFIKANGS